VKPWYLSKTNWIAIVQAIASVSMIVADWLNALGNDGLTVAAWLLLAKSIWDFINRTYFTTEAVYLVKPSRKRFPNQH
jgi:hypothetical protein